MRRVAEARIVGIQQALFDRRRRNEIPRHEIAVLVYALGHRHADHAGFVGDRTAGIAEIEQRRRLHPTVLALARDGAGRAQERERLFVGPAVRVPDDPRRIAFHGILGELHDGVVARQEHAHVRDIVVEVDLHVALRDVLRAGFIDGEVFAGRIHPVPIPSVDHVLVRDHDSFVHEESRSPPKERLRLIVGVIGNHDRRQFHAVVDGRVGARGEDREEQREGHRRGEEALHGITS